MQERLKNASFAISRVKAKCRNNHLPQGHALDNVFIERLAHGKRYTNNVPSTLSFSD